MSIELIKSIELVPKRHAFKARSYNNAELKNWVDFGSVRKDFNYLFNLILQAVLTQPEKDSPSFLACWLICSSRSSSNLIIFLVLLERSVFFLSFFSCIGAYLYDKLNTIGMHHYKGEYHKKQSPEVLPALSRDLTTNIKRSNAMANSNDTLRPKNGQPDLSNLISVLNLYQADIPTHHLLQAENHFEELQQSILYGIGAIGNLMFWASENESYSEQNLKSDMRDIGYLLAQLRDVACFASNQINLLDATQNHKGGK
nr:MULTISPECIES: hypothetical protein [Gilliamella]